MYTKADRSRNGKVNGKKAIPSIKLELQKRIDTYLMSPTLCKKCNTPLSYKKRKGKFCGHTCAARFNNLGVNRHGTAVNKNTQCQVCSKRLKNPNSKYCSFECNGTSVRQNTELRILQGLSVSTDSLRRYLHRTREHKCAICNGTEWFDSPMPLTMDHIDGNALNNSLDNLRLICANCDRLTPTFGSRNRGNGRQSRGVKRYDKYDK